MKGTDRDQVCDALAHIDVLRAHVRAGSLDQQVVVDAVCLRLAAAIDAVSRVDAAIREPAFSGAWPAVWATRNRIAHGYTFVDPVVIRATVENDLEGFEKALRRLLQMLP